MFLYSLYKRKEKIERDGQRINEWSFRRAVQG